MATNLPDMETENARTQEENLPAYEALSGPRGKLIGGGEVYFSHNRKSAVKARAAGKVPTAFLTAEGTGNGTGQQSIPYRAIAAALTYQVIPVAHVATRYVKANLLRAFIGSLLEGHEDALGEVLYDFADDLADKYGLVDGTESQDATPESQEPVMEEEGA